MYTAMAVGFDELPSVSVFTGDPGAYGFCDARNPMGVLLGVLQLFALQGGTGTALPADMSPRSRWRPRGEGIPWQ